MRWIRTAETVVARLVPYRWDWAHDEATAIARHWEIRKKAKPAIFDGAVLMLARLRETRGRVEADFFETSYARLTAWLDFGQPDTSVRNGFAMGALRGADGGFLLGRMGDHTANAGQLYFPAGTPDPTDVMPDGSVDLAGSMLREITEETGLAPADWTVAPRWVLVEVDGRLAFMKEVRLGLAAEAAKLHLERHLSNEARPELAGIEIASSESDIDETAMPAFMVAFLKAAWDDQIS